jgi:hypothetical protein
MKNINDTQEIWEWLYNSISHKISTHGRVCSVDRETISSDGKVTQRFGKILTLRHSAKEPHLNLSVSLCFKNKVAVVIKTIYVHKAVADHFIPKPVLHDSTTSKFNYQYVRHITDDYDNNFSENLIWITHPELISLQKNREDSGQRGWQTRRLKYGSTGHLKKEERILKIERVAKPKFKLEVVLNRKENVIKKKIVSVKKIIKEKKSLNNKVAKATSNPKREHAAIIKALYLKHNPEIFWGWCIYNVDKETIDIDNLIAVPRTIYHQLRFNSIDSTYYGIVKAVEDYLKINKNIIF